MAAQATALPAPEWRLARTPELHVLRAGIERLYSVLVVDRQLDVSELPFDGIMSARFFKRLLLKEVELKSCIRNEICAAQPDLKRLSLEHLLAIRVQLLEYTGAPQHDGSKDFLELLDVTLVEKLARHSLRNMPSAPACPSLRELGFRMMLVVGAAQILTGNAIHGDCAETTEVPKCWVLELERTDSPWPGCPIVIFHTEELLIEPSSGTQQELVTISSKHGGGRFATIRDVSSDLGQERLLSWSVTAHDPLTTDILGKVSRSDFALAISSKPNLIQTKSPREDSGYHGGMYRGIISKDGSTGYRIRSNKLLDGHFRCASSGEGSKLRPPRMFENTSSDNGSLSPSPCKTRAPSTSASIEECSSPFREMLDDVSAEEATAEAVKGSEVARFKPRETRASNAKAALGNPGGGAQTVEATSSHGWPDVWGWFSRSIGDVPDGGGDSAPKYFVKGPEEKGAPPRARTARKPESLKRREQCSCGVRSSDLCGDDEDEDRPEVFDVSSEVKTFV
jgi:hypothetical protein